MHIECRGSYDLHGSGEDEPEIRQLCLKLDREKDLSSSQPAFLSVDIDIRMTMPDDVILVQDVRQVDIYLKLLEEELQGGVQKQYIQGSVVSDRLSIVLSSRRYAYDLRQTDKCIQRVFRV